MTAKVGPPEPKVNHWLAAWFEFGPLMRTDFGFRLPSFGKNGLFRGFRPIVR
jgi:hypothetical protein